MTKEKEFKLIKNLQKGDRKAFTLIYKKYNNELFLFYLARLNNREDALDLTSELFIKVIKSIHTFKFKSSFRTWLYVVARNLLKDLYKKKSEKKEYNLLDDEIERLESKETADEESVEKSESLNKLTKILKKLPEKYRILLELRYLSSLTFKECGEVMGITENNAKVIHNRALKKAESIKV